jgi:starch synthase
MYQALEQAAQSIPSDERILLVECGWFANDYIQKAYADAQALACPSVQVVTLDGRKAEDRIIAWASADVFCSLSDNIQETFGIVPIEAMAAGLPVVVSDWDGYKDTVRDGIDGYRIPTIMPQAGLGGDLAYRHALEIDTYDMYCGHSCSLVSVDVLAAAQAFSQLFVSAALRAQQGQAGQERARSVYDWSVIIPQYETLWAQLGEIRKTQSAQLTPLAHPDPARLDPFYSFASYPTQALTLTTLLKLVDGELSAALTRSDAYLKLAMVNFAKVVLPTSVEINAILMQAANGTQTAEQLIQSFPANRQAFMLRSLAWFVKMNLLKVVAN